MGFLTLEDFMKTIFWLLFWFFYLLQSFAFAVPPNLDIATITIDLTPIYILAAITLPVLGIMLIYWKLRDGMNRS